MHPKPAGPLQTLIDIPWYVVPGAVHPNAAGPLQTLNGIPLDADPGAVHPKPGLIFGKQAKWLTTCARGSGWVGIPGDESQEDVKPC